MAAILYGLLCVTLGNENAFESILAAQYSPQGISVFSLTFPASCTGFTVEKLSIEYPE